MGGFLGSLTDTGAAEALQKNEANYNYIKSLFGDITGNKGVFGQLNQGYAQGGEFLRAMVAEARAGKAGALQAIGGQGREAYRSIADQTTQSVSAANQRAISSGLYNSTAGAGAARQAAYQGARATGQMGAQLGGLFAQTQLAGSRGVQGALGQTAQFYAQRGRDFASAGSALGNILSRYSWQPTQSIFSQIAPVIGAGLGSFLGPIGTALGAQIGKKVTGD